MPGPQVRDIGFIISQHGMLGTYEITCVVIDTEGTRREKRIDESFETMADAEAFVQLVRQSFARKGVQLIDERTYKPGGSA